MRFTGWIVSGAEPKLIGKKIKTGLNFIMDMTYVWDGRRPVLIAANLKSLHAFDVQTNERIWSSDVQANSVTTDGRGYVLVCNFYDYYIKVVSLSHGKDLGHLVRKGDKVLGKPSMVW